MREELRPVWVQSLRERGRGGGGGGGGEAWRGGEVRRYSIYWLIRSCLSLEQACQIRHCLSQSSHPIHFTYICLFDFFPHTETQEEAHGVFRQTWDKRLDYQQSVLLRDNPYFESPPSSSGIIPNFDAPVNAADNYGQRLLAYFQVCCHIPNDWLWLTD